MGLKAVALCVSVVAGVFPTMVQAQSASKVIERHIEAIGGKKAVERIVSTEISGRVSSADGRSGAFTQRTKRPHLYYAEASWDVLRWRTGFNGRSAWPDDTAGVQTLFGQGAARVRAEAAYANTRLLMSEKLNRVTVIGRDQMRGQPVIVVVALTSDGIARTLYFDAKSYLLLKDEQQTDVGLEARVFDDYRPVDQVMEPHRIEWHRNGETLRIDVERITHNTALDDHLFDVPVAPADPALNIDAVLSATRENDRRAGRLRESYAYTQTVTGGRIDERGRMAEREFRTYEVFHLESRPVGRLLKKDGQPLSEAERRREDERVSSLVREYERLRLAGRAEGRRDERSRLDAGIIGMPIIDWLSAFLSTSDFSGGRRERVRGRPAIVVEFQPKPGVAPREGSIERLTSSMAGTLWIDEASRHTIRLESYYRNDFDPVIEGSSWRMERTLVNDEVWLPSRDEQNSRRSFAFGTVTQGHLVIQYTDHKKFGVESDFKTALP